MSIIYNPEYYGAPDAHNMDRDLYEGEVNVVENIKNEKENKKAIIEADESIFSPLKVSPPRDLYPGEMDVVDNLENFIENKEAIIKSPDEDKETVDIEVYHSEY